MMLPLNIENYKRTYDWGIEILDRYTILKVPVNVSCINVGVKKYSPI